MKLVHAFPAFRERNFRLYFYAQVISLAGTYMQSTAQSWLVFELTGSALWVGFNAMLVYLPVFLLVLLGGAFADRFNRRKILYFTQTIAMVLAFILGLLTIIHHVNLLEVNILSLLLGIVNALDTPTRSAFISDITADRGNLASAISLNSGMATAALAVGPGIAGILIATIGTGLTFIVNGLTFIAVLIALYLMNIQSNSVETKEKAHPIAMVKTGLKYFLSNGDLLFLVILCAAITIFGRSYYAMMPVVAVQVYHGGSEALGYLLSASGVGAMIGTLVFSIFSKKISAKIWIVVSNILVALPLIAFAFTHVIIWGLLFIFVTGFGFAIELTALMTIIQHTAPDALVGRALSVYFLFYFGAVSLGYFVIGLASSKFGSLFAIGTGGIIALLIGLLVFFFKDRIIELA